MSVQLRHDADVLIHRAAASTGAVARRRPLRRGARPASSDGDLRDRPAGDARDARSAGPPPAP